MCKEKQRERIAIENLILIHKEREKQQKKEIREKREKKSELRKKEREKEKIERGRVKQ